MNKRKDKKESSLSKLLLRIRRKLYRKEWIESRDKVRLLKWQLVRTKIKMKYSSELVSKFINFGMAFSRRRWKMK
tara:strand:- start:949 stop:1173 length:225 start_codon:yes stop_codon:yes gene_type:complete